MNVLYEIPVNVILVDDPSGTYTTNRTKKEIDEIFPNVNQIWESAQIRFEINKIQRKTIESNEIELLFDWNKINDPPFK